MSVTITVTICQARDEPESLKVRFAATNDGRPRAKTCRESRARGQPSRAVTTCR